LRTDIERLLGQMSGSDLKLLKKKEWGSPLALVDGRLPNDEKVIALAFHRHIYEGGILVVTDSRLLYVTGSVQSWKFPDIKNVTQSKKQDIVQIHIDAEDKHAWTVTNGSVFIPALVDMVNEAKFNEI
jgi:hypothetical protein